MNSKINSVDYSKIAAKFISDENLSLIIQQNISFVEKYIDDVESSFDNNIEKQIVFRELGSIVYSGIEALFKSVLFEIIIRCKKRRCKKKNCKYRTYYTLESINRASSLEALKLLLNVRLLGLTPNQIDEISKLNDLRNYVHLSKNIGKNNNDIFFDKKYVEKLLFYYYEVLDQLDLADYYFGSKDSCLKNIDDNGFKFTEKQIESDNKSFYLLQAFHSIDKVFNNKELSNNDKWVLNEINYESNINYDELINYIDKEIAYSRRHFDNEKEFENAKNSFETNLNTFIRNSVLKNRIKNELKKIKY